MKKFWMIAAALCAGTALFFAVRGQYDNAFIAAVFGAVSWFLNYRTQLREKLGNTDFTDEEDADHEES